MISLIQVSFILVTNLLALGVVVAMFPLIDSSFISQAIQINVPAFSENGVSLIENVSDASNVYFTQFEIYCKNEPNHSVFCPATFKKLQSFGRLAIYNEAVNPASTRQCQNCDYKVKAEAIPIQNDHYVASTSFPLMKATEGVGFSITSTTIFYKWVLSQLPPNSLVALSLFALIGTHLWYRLAKTKALCPSSPEYTAFAYSQDRHQSPVQSYTPQSCEQARTPGFFPARPILMEHQPSAKGAIDCLPADCYPDQRRSSAQSSVLPLPADYCFAQPQSPLPDDDVFSSNSRSSSASGKRLFAPSLKAIVDQIPRPTSKRSQVARPSDSSPTPQSIDSATLVIDSSQNFCLQSGALSSPDSPSSTSSSSLANASEDKSPSIEPANTDFSDSTISIFPTEEISSSKATKLAASTTFSVVKIKRPSSTSTSTSSPNQLSSAACLSEATSISQTLVPTSANNLTSQPLLPPSSHLSLHAPNKYPQPYWEPPSSARTSPMTQNADVSKRSCTPAINDIDLDRMEENGPIITSTPKVKRRGKSPLDVKNYQACSSVMIPGGKTDIIDVEMRDIKPFVSLEAIDDIVSGFAELHLNPVDRRNVHLPLLNMSDSQLTMMDVDPPEFANFQPSLLPQYLVQLDTICCDRDVEMYDTSPLLPSIGLQQPPPLIMADFDVDMPDAGPISPSACTIEMQDIEMQDVEIWDIEIQDVEMQDIEMQDDEMQDVEMQDIELDPHYALKPSPKLIPGIAIGNAHKFTADPAKPIHISESESDSDSDFGYPPTPTPRGGVPSLLHLKHDEGDRRPSIDPVSKSNETKSLGITSLSLSCNSPSTYLDGRSIKGRCETHLQALHRRTSHKPTVHTLVTSSSSVPYCPTVRMLY